MNGGLRFTLISPYNSKLIYLDVGILQRYVTWGGASGSGINGQVGDLGFYSLKLK